MSLFEDVNLHIEALKHLLIDAEIGPMDSARAIIECRISEWIYVRPQLSSLRQCLRSQNSTMIHVIVRYHKDPYFFKKWDFIYVIRVSIGDEFVNETEYMRL